jgi:hypothetical protein
MTLSNIQGLSSLLLILVDSSHSRSVLGHQWAINVVHEPYDAFGLLLSREHLHIGATSALTAMNALVGSSNLYNGREFHSGSEDI